MSNATAIASLLWKEKTDPEDPAEIRMLAIGEWGTIAEQRLANGAERVFNRLEPLFTVEDAFAALVDIHLMLIVCDFGVSSDVETAKSIVRAAQSNGVVTTVISRDSQSSCLSEMWSSQLGTIVRIPKHQSHELVFHTARGIAQTILVQGHISLDFEDVRIALFEHTGISQSVSALASGPQRAQVAADIAIHMAESEGVLLSAASGVLVLISAAEGTLKLSESKVSMTAIREYCNPDASLIYATYDDDSLEDQIRVTLISSGVGQ